MAFLPNAISPAQTHHERSLYRTAGKRFFDIVLLLVALPVILPVITLLALAILCHGHAPLYAQDRIGRDGVVFKFWKLRTMVADNQAILVQHLADNADARQEWSHSQKLRNDPRVTRFGGWLRKTSLDELPQLWNVLRGDMSLVGPRPMMPCQAALYSGDAYNKMRPGITGLWQVSKRNQSSFAERAEYDAQYFTNISLLGDLRVLASTVPVVLCGTGY